MIKSSFMKQVLAFMLGLILTSFLMYILTNNEPMIQNQLTYLSQPVASEKILITSAGQSTDTYIIKDVANELLLENIFIPNAKTTDLEGVNSIVIVIGHSHIGELLHDIEFEDEILRVEQLIEDANQKSLPIIGVYIGGQMRNNKKNNTLIDLVFSSSTYNLVVGESNHIESDFDVPMIHVDNIRQIKGPFSSLFR